MGSDYVRIKPEDEMIFKRAVKSQDRSPIYESLRQAGRVERCLDVLRLCGHRKYSIGKTADMLKQMFPIHCNRLSTKELRVMMQLYPDVEEAWAFSKELDIMRSYSNAAKISRTTTSIDDVIKFHQHFDNTDMSLFVPKRDDESGDDDNITQVNIFNSRLED